MQPTFNSLQEKYEYLAAKARPQRGTIWVTNEAMNASFEHRGNPVLIEIPQSHFSAYQDQGYSQFKPSAKVAPPVEAKAVPGKVSDTKAATANKPGRKAKEADPTPDPVTENPTENVDSEK